MNNMDNTEQTQNNVQQASVQPMRNKGGVALRKRTQIAIANRTMFVWVAGVSVLVGFALVIGIFLVQMLIFNEKILAEKSHTVETLRDNIKNIDTLSSQVRALDANANLISSKANPDDETLQVVLDALPSVANSPALGASIQQKLLGGIDNISIDSLQPDLVVGIESLTNNSIENASAASSADKQSEITFRFSVTGDYEALEQVLLNLEKSIRTIDVISMTIQSNNGRCSLSVQGRAYYEPERIVELKDKLIRQ